MKIRIPIPSALTADVPYEVEFDADKIAGVQLSGGVGGSRLILEFASLEDAPKWVQAEQGAEGLVRRRPPAERLRYLADKLREGGNDIAVSFTLDVMADEAKGD